MTTQQEVYVVVKTGVYMQGTWGPYASLKEACSAARDLADKDSDCYHEWEVCTISTDGLGDDLGSASKNCTTCTRGSKQCRGPLSNLPES